VAPPLSGDPEITILAPAAPIAAAIAIKPPFGSLVRRYRWLSSAVPLETCLYNSAANPVMVRKTCFVEQFAERRVRLNTFTGAQVNLEMILCIRSLSSINAIERTEQFIYKKNKEIRGFL